MPVEPIAILTTVLATARAINAWLKDKDRKQAIIVDLTQVTQNLCDILQPLAREENRRKLDKKVLSLLLEIAEALTSTKEHLAVWQAKSTTVMTVLGFISPGKVVDSLRDDQMKLKERITLLTLALQVAAMPSIDTEVESPGQDAKVSENPQDYLEGVTNEDVRAFWAQNFGQDIFVFDSFIPSAIGQWTKEDIDEQFGSALIRSIDTKDIGVTTPKSLSNFAGAGTLRVAVITLKQQLSERSRSILDNPITDPTAAPTLVWIDDNPHNNSLEVEQARNRGVTVVQIPSTAVAKLWIEENLVYLKQLEAVNKLRFITDNARWERDGRKGEFMNLSAGELTLRFLRATSFTCPVLVYTGASIPGTQYVLRFSRAGSTVSSNVCLAFIEELATDVDNRSRWEGFDKS